MRDYCGVVGIYGNKNAAQLTYLALYALQHRGEESAGIVSFDGKKVSQQKGMGHVGEVFTETNLKKLKGHTAIGHVRYSTTGSSIAKNVQPLLINHKKGFIAVAHNGNLTNSVDLRNELEDAGSILQTTMDSELILHYLVKDHQNNYSGKILSIASRLEGAYSFVLMINDAIYALRDPYGFRPLCIGKIDGGYIVASETCALDMIQATYIRDIEPGEVVIIDRQGLRSMKQPQNRKHAFCIFEYIYFSRPDSNIYTQSVYLTRKNLGRTLAKEHPAQADFVMPIPDSGTYAAMGYAEESKLPLEMAFVRNHYIGRTFIQPSQLIRDFKVKVKLNPVRDVLKGKRIVIVEDSIVRGTTSRGRVRALRAAGAAEIHMRVSCPPLMWPCFYGIDFPTRKELIAANHTIEDIRKFIGVDSLAYLSLDGMLNSMLLSRDEFCTACFTGNYPTRINKPPSKKSLEKNRIPAAKKA
ncbi:MAG: amidophosphoribosyltransferase [Candidatus Omnitrophica bacterium]|nr:amidophosphoribosyltransferase [Candidatus Omnitrophota bacterium]MCM8790198.1 amidophosphoribosyltransferase [Candidatus Omnitrophota bacterium]